MSERAGDEPAFFVAGNQVVKYIAILFDINYNKAYEKRKRGGSLMPAPHGNTNAVKAGEGVQVSTSFYLTKEEVIAIKRKLSLQEIEPTSKNIRAYARKQMKNGLWLAIRDELPAIIV
jgi:hypothetical protein